jgi:hypothetical protein
MTEEEWALLNQNFQGNFHKVTHFFLLGDSYKDLLEYYDDIHTFITRLCLAEKLPQSCISTAMVFFHKYFILKKAFSNDLEKYLTCASCILLSVKVCNQLTPLEELVRFFLKQYLRQTHMTHIVVDDQLVFETSEKLCLLEFEILSAAGFDLNLDLPYKYVHQMKFYYFDYLKNSKLIIITTNFINDSFKLPLCLYYDPILVALACLYLASVYFKVPLVDTKDCVKWYNILDKSVELKQVVALSEKINKIYKFCSEPKKGEAKKRKIDPRLQFTPLGGDVLKNNVNEQTQQNQINEKNSLFSENLNQSIYPNCTNFRDSQNVLNEANI